MEQIVEVAQESFHKPSVKLHDAHTLILKTKMIFDGCTILDVHSTYVISHVEL